MHSLTKVEQQRTTRRPWNVVEMSNYVNSVFWKGEPPARHQSAFQSRHHQRNNLDLFCLSHFIFLTTRTKPQCLRLHDTPTSQTYDQPPQRPTAQLSPTRLLPNRFSQLKRLPMPNAQPRKVGEPTRIMIRIVISSVSPSLTAILKSECSLSAKSTLSSWFNCLPRQECQFFSLCRRPRTLPIRTRGSCGSLWSVALSACSLSIGRGIITRRIWSCWVCSLCLKQQWSG